MNEHHNNLTEIKLPTEDSKNSLKNALNGISKSFLIKVKCIYLFSISILYTKVFIFRFNPSNMKKIED